MVNRIRSVIVDDEPWAIDLLKSYISKIDWLELVYASNDPVAVLNFLATEKIDLLFLDIQMPEMNGIDLMEIIDPKTKIIVTTAYSEYALKTYEHNIVDYLLKPIDFARFCKAAQRAREYLALRDAKSGTYVWKRNFLFIKTDGKLVKLFFHEILFVEGLKDYIAIQTGTEKIISLDSLSNMERVLPLHLFHRVHKSFITSIDKIDSIERNRIFIGSFILPIGDSYKTAFMNWLGK